MKKRIITSVIAAVLLIVGIAIAADLQPIAVTFIGRWQPTDDPVLIDDHGLQDIQNLRKSGKHFKGIKGHRIINSTSISAFPHFLNGFHFLKTRTSGALLTDGAGHYIDSLTESHVIVLAADSATPTASHLYQITDVPPSAATFSATTLHTDENVGIGFGRFSKAPGGQMVYSNGPETLIWGGNEMFPTAFITASAALTGDESILSNPNDYTSQMRNAKTTADQLATLGSGIDDYTVLLLHGNGTDGSTTITASETTAHTVTANGNAQVDTAQYKFSSGSILFDSSGDYLSVPDSDDWAFGDGDFTVDFWARFNALPAERTAMVIFSQRSDYDNRVLFMLKNYKGNYYFDMDICSSGTCESPTIGANWTWATPVVNTWYHIALIREDDEWLIYIDGTLLNQTPTIHTITYPNITASLYIGGYGSLLEGVNPVDFTTDYVKATSDYGASGRPWLATDPSLPTTGAAANNSWLTASSGSTSQRFHIDLGEAIKIRRIWLSNYHSSGSETDRGAKDFTVWGSNSSTAFADLVYSHDTNWVQVSASTTTLAQHPASDTLSAEYINLDQDASTYQYWALKFANNYGDANYMGIRRIYLMEHSIDEFNGWIDEFRISKGIARWTEDFTPPTKAYRLASNNVLVGSTRPLQGVRFYVKDANTVTSTLTGSYWNGASWSSLTLTDGTASGGISMAKTGTVTFSSLEDLAKQRYINGHALYWVQFTLSDGMASLYQATVDAPMQSIRNVWDGSLAYATKAVVFTSTAYEDYTDVVNDQAPSTTMIVSSESTAFSTSGYILIGFTEAMQAIKLSFDAGKENKTASTTMSGYYWDGSDWTGMSAMTDGTATTTTSLSKNGVVSWQAPGAGVEFPTAIGDETPLYYYMLSFASEVQGEVEIGEIRGVAAPNPITPYRFSEVFQNHLFLFNEYHGQRNKAIYSMSDAPDIFNGAYTGTFYFGDDSDVISAANVYNVFGNSAYDQLIVAKNSEIYRVSGDSPSAWTSKRISSTIGCASPLSMVSAAIESKTEGENPKNVVIWQGYDGFYMTDGSAVTPISDDIKVYFDANDSRCISSDRITQTVAWYDPSIPAYKALISSGSTATDHNVELEFSLADREWTKIVRKNASGADPLQCAFRVFDTDGIGYTYGGTKTGFLYRLEYGATFAGTAIEQMLWTKDMILDVEAPLFRKATIKHLRTAHKQKTNGGTMTVAHYGDKVLTVDGTSNQVVPDAINMATAPYNTQSCNLGPFLYHSLKYTLSGSTVADGMELIGLGIWSEPYTTLR